MVHEEGVTQNRPVTGWKIFARWQLGQDIAKRDGLDLLYNILYLR